MANPSSRHRAIESVRNWNAVIRPGHRVLMDGKEHVTDSPAGLGYRDDPVVGLAGIDEPVPLSRLEVPGMTWGPVTKRANTKPGKRR